MSYESYQSQKFTFEPKRSDHFYGFFGYEGYMCDKAIRTDNVEAFLACVENEWLDKDCKTLDGHSMVTYAERYGAKECAAEMRKMGWQ